ncbi:MAG: dephospho-CoA kinase [Bacteroidales bacterium]|nr:dephospho-CoA kinase [Bacteroidales bacterium]
MAPVLIITGGIGSGKSTVVRLLLEMYPRAAAYCADQRAKELYLSREGLLEAIEEALGTCLRPEGHFVPALMASRIFGDEKAVEAVEKLLFPAIKEDFAAFAGSGTACGAPFIIFESATVLEKEAFEGFGDKVFLVDAPLETRLARACMRDGASREEVLARMEKQRLMNAFSQGTLTKFADGSALQRAASRVDEVIHNDSTEDVLRERLAAAVSRSMNL